MDFVKETKPGEDNNYDDVERQVNNAYRNRQQKVHSRVASADSEFLDEVIEVNVINKRVLGKVMVKYCGNEGTQNDARTASLRKLLQAAIDFIQSDPKHTNWHNAEITVYDLDDNSFRIISGHGKHQYVVSDGENGNTEIVNTSNKVNKTRQIKEKNPPQSGYPSAKRHHRQANEGLHTNTQHQHTRRGGQHHEPRYHQDNGGKQGGCLIC